MTRTECIKLLKVDSVFTNLYYKNYCHARKHFPLCKIKGVVLHHINVNCTNYEEWNVDELVPMFKSCHRHLHEPWNKGILTGSMPQEIREKISKTLKGVKPANLETLHSPEIRKKALNKLCSPETRRKISESLKGRPSIKKGKPWPAARRAAQDRKEKKQ